MESLAESMPGQETMPRFGDGSINLRELVRSLAEDVVNAIMDAEADQLCAAGAKSRNGYRERNLVMCEQDEQWSASRYFAYGKILELYDEKRAKDSEGPERPAAELAETARKTIIASLELAEKVEAA